MTHKRSTSSHSSRELKEVKRRLRREMDRLLHGFTWDPVPLTKWEKSNKITAREFLQL